MTHEQYIRSLEKKVWKTLAEISIMHKQTKEEQEKWRKQQEKERKQREKERKQRADEREKEQKQRAEWRLEWDKEMGELRANQKQTDKQLKIFMGFSGHCWGKLGENLVKGSLVQKLKQRGIKQINRVVTNARIGDVEYDIIAVNGKEVVIVEVKAVLEPSDVHHFIKNINKFKVHWPEYKDKIIYGGIAFLLKSKRRAEELAEREGFFVIEAVGDVIIKNKESFKPKIFASM